MKLHNAIAFGAAATLLSLFANAAVTAEEAKALGTTLTPYGAEKAGNADGTIPAYTGGLTTPPASFKSGSGIRPNPFANEKPRLVITAANMAEHEAKLTAGTKELLKRFPKTFRVDVYPTHRTAAVPKYVLDNTVKNATSAKTTNGGEGLQGAYAGVPFPIPKTGHEVMWNHALHYAGHVMKYKLDAYTVSGASAPVLASVGEVLQEWPIYDPKRTGVISESDNFYRSRLTWLAPARRFGEGMLVKNTVNPLVESNRAWIYLPGQRRVKLAPEVGYDAPNPGSSGLLTFDDALIFNGALDRFDFKLVGKKEFYIPYNAYKMVYEGTKEEIHTPNHLNPDFVRWELHRVWVVEATLKPGKRHVYAKRVFYVDEDSWASLTADQYDARGQLFKALYAFMAPAYDVPAPESATMMGYDFVAGAYVTQASMFGSHYGVKFIEPVSEIGWTPESLSGAGVR